MSGSAFPSRRLSIADRIRVVLVCGYLLLVGAWLIRKGRIPVTDLTRVLRARRRPPFEGALENIRHEAGQCYTLELPSELLSDQESISAVQVFEDGRPLGPGHAGHADIRALGAGRFSHWKGQLYFSASDNSDPRVNGRRYLAREVRR